MRQDLEEVTVKLVVGWEKVEGGEQLLGVVFFITPLPHPLSPQGSGT